MLAVKVAFVRAAGVLAKGCMFDMPELEDELQNKNKTS
jgi:hypothetical protein